ncbi:MAG: hypothetical protein QF367_00095 [Acidimicrobiales bacterium]|jgi:hypothetical protein|nr:hypothetical protein [Actinomycetes bacterium]MDP6106236.1 hypothetical protein [Acidimicrobiales bacterium]MCP4844214.1 hypothetical protein [Actinomycetes bacterium]MDP6240123.1 hypothetical protein [Acidimicrobiales bacterium]MDP7123635.1 hypothetical protein [Acidimicrobiales bacterium]|tara:strand:+ start:15270 stop:15425 length:156 start_codon:yes stop_codon:yes gene_type:complete
MDAGVDAGLDAGIEGIPHLLGYPSEAGRFDVDDRRMIPCDNVRYPNERRPT